MHPFYKLGSVQFSSCQSCLTLNNYIDCSTPGLPVYQNSQSLLKPMSTGLVMPSNHLILCCPLLLPASGSFQMSQFFASGGQSIRISASASVLPMNIQGWFPFGLTGWNFLVVQGTLKSLFQHSSKASILQCSAFCIVRLSHLYVSTGKTIALTRWSFVG